MHVWAFQELHVHIPTLQVLAIQWQSERVLCHHWRSHHAQEVWHHTWSWGDRVPRSLVSESCLHDGIYIYDICKLDLFSHWCNIAISIPSKKNHNHASGYIWLALERIIHISSYNQSSHGDWDRSFIPNHARSKDKTSKAPPAGLPASLVNLPDPVPAPEVVGSQDGMGNDENTSVEFCCLVFCILERQWKTLYNNIFIYIYL